MSYRPSGRCYPCFRGSSVCRGISYVSAGERFYVRRRAEVDLDHARRATTSTSRLPLLVSYRRSSSSFEATAARVSRDVRLDLFGMLTARDLGWATSATSALNGVGGQQTAAYPQICIKYSTFITCQSNTSKGRGHDRLPN